MTGPTANDALPTPRWMTTVLRAAGVYNVLWGAFAILAPSLVWRWLDMPQPNYPFLWQCIGMIVGVYGVGYWVAAADPARHWPIVLVGLLGKVFGPIGFLQAWLIDGAVPARFGVLLLTNDLVWWVPFVLILRHAYTRAEARRAVNFTGPQASPPLAQAMESARTSTGESLGALSRRAPVLVVFLRHAGCTFCREALADLAQKRAEIERAGATICLVHMGNDERARAWFGRYGLESAARISDPAQVLYNAFELRRGTLGQLFGWRSFVRGIKAGLVDGHGVGRLEGDGFQMPGAFLVRDGTIVRAYRHRAASDRPDYCELATA